MIYDEEKVLVQERVKFDWFGITFPDGHTERGPPAHLAPHGRLRL